MPERIALKRVIVGGGKKEQRHIVEPGQRYNFSAEDAAHLDSKDPPVVQKPAQAEREARAAQRSDGSALAGVAEPVTDGDDHGNTTREPPADEKDDL